MTIFAIKKITVEFAYAEDMTSAEADTFLYSIKGWVATTRINDHTIELHYPINYRATCPQCHKGFSIESIDDDVSCPYCHHQDTRIAFMVS